MANIRVDVILPKELVNTTQLDRALSNTTKGILKNIKVDFGVTTQTWNNKPDFEIKQTDTIEGTVSTDSKIYKFVSGGTRVRYATMTPDFKAKTQPRIIASRTGKGGVAFIRRDRPKPGIKARKFTETIAKKWRKLYPRVVQRAIDSEFG